ncbi:MAG: alpha/beta fold hydrolase [Propionivibrio sp.]|uniref:alpha/beta fold hydrolase n=1 Tax=Propionivibrio sp. TaxID=2212460 RepID=UPI0025F4D2DC|nr:alpha/beta fold hydrolase [Propionivibrio sp.]MBL0207388.1 alpha/beta fold hydrolase [Propionivibrio sp.]
MNNSPLKPDLALIHGWGLGPTVWQPVLPLLSQRFNVHVLALPGYGTPETLVNSQPSGEPIQATASFTRTAETLVKTLPDKCILCGWSLGGMLALQAALLAAQGGKTLRGLILVGSTPRFTQGVDWPHAQPESLLDTFIAALATDAAVTLSFYRPAQSGRHAGASARRTFLKQLRRSLPDTATLLVGLGWLRDVDLRQQLAAIDVPTLLVHENMTR